MPELSNTVAVVTGGRIGLGRALALEAAHRGATVVIASQSDAARTVSEIQATTGAAAEWVRTDVADYASVEALAHHVRTTYGGTNILVNNAASGGDPGRLDTTDPAAARRLFEVNVTGVFNGIRAFAADLKTQAAQGAPAHILNVGSEHSLGVPPHVAPLSAYTVSKYATLAFTDTARRDFTGTGVNVSLLAPGWVLTERVTELTDASPQAAGAILPYAQDSAEVAQLGIDGLLRNRYIIATNPASRAFAIEHAQAVIGEVEHLSVSPRG
ncbi:SDR family oxidoreductase [Streptomyces sp. NPDC005859]|uniref:SDR family NAD(P)-dependent oxidoreductase n=1 Tax=Streptomyces sp. NPDC005859 TaxID=3157170 RepID=UPI0034066FC0